MRLTLVALLLLVGFAMLAPVKAALAGIVLAALAIGYRSPRAREWLAERRLAHEDSTRESYPQLLRVLDDARLDGSSVVGTWQGAEVRVDPHARRRGHDASLYARSSMAGGSWEFQPAATLDVVERRLPSKEARNVPTAPAVRAAIDDLVGCGATEVEYSEHVGFSVSSIPLDLGEERLLRSALTAFVRLLAATGATPLASAWERSVTERDDDPARGPFVD